MGLLPRKLPAAWAAGASETKTARAAKRYVVIMVSIDCLLSLRLSLALLVVLLGSLGQTSSLKIFDFS